MNKHKSHRRSLRDKSPSLASIVLVSFMLTPSRGAADTKRNSNQVLTYDQRRTQAELAFKSGDSEAAYWGAKQLLVSDSKRAVPFIARSLPAIAGEVARDRVAELLVFAGL